ncbi:MAG: manganese efflux pump [Clostridia bacterium]|nr:manganese efflux pump [Clostridia bacterium]
MSFIEVLLIGIGLSADAFAVAVCKGLNMRKINYTHALIIALFFGGFQALMPLIGWILGSSFRIYIENFDHWIAFVLLAFIGGKMIVEALKNEDEGCCSCEKLDIKELFVMAVATSIDALAVGITFALVLEKGAIWGAISIIGLTTFVLSAIGVVIGNKFGAKYKSKAELAGGIILVLIGLKILLEHLEIISF